MRSAGCAPADTTEIILDGEDHYYKLEGDKKDKRGGYCLTIESDGFAWGNFRSFKTGQSGKWHSGKGSKVESKEEKSAREERIKSAEAVKKAATDRRHAEAAIEAKILWESCAPAENHDYLARKGIRAHGGRLDGADLIYTGVSGGKIYTYQRIQIDGTKLFMPGAKKQGCYYAMTTAAEPKDIIIICEGIATGGSIREATALPVLAAFDAGNLNHVAREMRAKYPKSIIIIAADNDSRGEKNTGILSAQQAAGRNGGFATWPEFEDGSDLTDFNDLHQTKGLEAVKDKILTACKNAAGNVASGISGVPLNVQPTGHDYFNESVPLPEPDNRIPFHIEVETGKLSPTFDDKKINNSLMWKKWPSEMDAGKLEPNNMHNILVFLRHHEKYLGLYRHDRFAGRVILRKEPFWQFLLGEKFRVTEVRAEHVDYMEASMAKDGLAANGDKIHRAIYTVAKENWINPPLEYFENLRWDKVSRLSKWLQNYLGAEGDSEYLSAVGMAFLIAGAARIYQPGCKAENMLVLEGKQGVMKSTALSVLANIGRGEDEESYFCDTLGFDQIGEKDTVLKTKGKLIIEIPDLAGLGNREIEAVKAWMSVQHDEIRVPYGKDMEKFPRQFILAGSTNESHWLKDQTGNRRFWPVKCGKINIYALKEDREQLWAEAVHLYKNKAIWWIGRDNPVWEKTEIEQTDRLQEDIWYQPIQRFVKGSDFVTVREILESFKIEVKDQTQRHQRQVSDILKRLGYVSKKKRLSIGMVSGWEREAAEPSFIPETAEEIEF